MKPTSKSIADFSTPDDIINDLMRSAKRPEMRNLAVADGAKVCSFDYLIIPRRLASARTMEERWRLAPLYCDRQTIVVSGQSRLTLPHAQHLILP